MKSTILLLAAAGIVLSHATKHLKLHGSAAAQPKTAFCMTGNVRANHAEHPSRELRKRLDMIDPNGMVFAYVNPCEAQTKPWWWEASHQGQKTKTFVPKKIPENCWQGSFWKEHVKPSVVKEYSEADVNPVPRPCNKGAAVWAPGAYQQWKGVQECFKLIQEYEEKHSFKFETIARFRADACHDEEGCRQVSYCSVDQLDRKKVYMHKHNAAEKPVYFDNWVILPRHHAETYFNVLDLYFLDCKVGGAGESVLGEQMWKHRVPTEDKCECHPIKGKYCPPPGGGFVLVERSFQSDLETYTDASMLMETQPTMHFLNVPSGNAASSEFVKPAYMRLRLQAS